MHDILRVMGIVACTLIGSPALGQPSGESRTYAVLSLIGDKISVVGHRAATGSNMDRNRQGSLAVESQALDNTALLAAIDAIKRLDAGAATVGLSSHNASLYELQNELFEPQEQSIALVAFLKELAQGQNATHLILITKHRGDALLRLRDLYTGSGKIEGLGFYLDSDLRTSRSDTHASGPGFMAPFAYIKIALIDVKTMGVVREQIAEESLAISTANAVGSLRPEDVFTPKQKVAVLQSMVRKAVAHAMSDLLATK